MKRNQFTTYFTVLVCLVTLILACNGSDSGGEEGSGPTTIVSDPRIAMDDSGNTILVGQYNWFDESNQKTAVYYNIYHLGSGWEYAMATGNHLTDKDAVFARQPAVAMDATGNGIVAWGQRSGTGGEYEIYAQVYLATGSWYAAQPIGFYDPPIYIGGDASNPQVAMDGSGNAVVVWQKYNPVDDNYVIFAQRWDHASQQWWPKTYPISTGTPAFDTPNPRIAMSANGDAIAIWQETSQASNGIFANRLAKGQTVWSSGTKQWIAQNNNLPLVSNPQITMDRNGNAIVVWDLNGDSYAVRYSPATGWTPTAEQIDAGTGDATDPQIATNGWFPGSGSDRVMTVWNEDSGAGTPTNIYARLYSVGSWLPPEPIESGGGAAYYPQVAMNDSGRVRAVWKQKVTTGAGTVYQIHANRFAIGSNWEGERQIETPGHKGDVSNQQIVMNNNGIAIAAWDDGSRTAGGIIHTYVWDSWEPWGQPIASFTYAPPSPNAGDLVTFDASGSTDNGTIVSYEWDFNYDGSTFNVDATGITATHTYSTTGAYTVGLRVTDDGGLTDETTQQVTVGTVATYTVGGTVSGLTGGTLVLQNNGGDNLSITADGSFTFATPLAEGSNYDVTVLTQPADQKCSVSNGSGTISGASVTDVVVTCTATGACITVAPNWDVTETNIVITDDPYNRCGDDPGPYKFTYTVTSQSDCYLYLQSSQFNEMYMGPINGNTASLTGSYGDGPPGFQDIVDVEKTLTFSGSGSSTFTGSTIWTRTFAGPPPQEYCSGTSDLAGTAQ
jgi:PKD repeat protein